MNLNCFTIHLFFYLAGPLCISKHREKQDRRLDDDFPTFKKFNRSLTYTCEEGEAGILEITPNTSWPDVVYYNSFTQSDMGWKIHIVDSFSYRVSGAEIVNSRLQFICYFFLLGSLYKYLF